LGIALFSLGNWLLLYFYSAREVGIYSFALLFGLAYDTLIAQSLNIIYMPYFFGQINEKGLLKTIKKHFALVFMLAGAAVAVLFIPNFLFSYFSLFIQNKEYFQSFGYIKYFISSYIIFHAISLVIMVFMHYKNVEKITVSLFFGVLINIILSLILIPRYSIAGAVFSMWISYTFLFVICFLLCLAFVKKINFSIK
jgi:O-antigen/teichoic acid export membrane protein